MRRMLVLLLLLAACASRDGLVDERTRDCSAGQDVSIDLNLNVPTVMTENTTDNLTMFVTIGNNSTHDIEVKAIRVEPGFAAQERYSLESSYGEYNQVIVPGDDEEFRLPVLGRAGTRQGYRRGSSNTMDVALSVYMADGDKFRCVFDVEAPR
jgi:hypothetical protein